jgi:hypothetical protein
MAKEKKFKKSTNVSFYLIKFQQKQYCSNLWYLSGKFLLTKGTLSAFYREYFENGLVATIQKITY